MVLESELLCWKSHVNENTTLGGWLVLISMQWISQDFSHFHFVCSSLSPLPSLAVYENHFKQCRLHLVLCLKVFTHTHRPLHFFFYITLPSFPDFHQSLPVLCINIKCLIWYKQFVSNLLAIISFLYSVYSGICIRKYILGWIIPPRWIFFGRVMASSCTLRRICVKSDLRKQVLLVV